MRPPPDIRLSRSEPKPHKARSAGRLQLHWSGRWQEAALFDRAVLTPGAAIDGPAIVVQEDTTLVISPGWHAHVDAFGNIVLEQA